MQKEVLDNIRDAKEIDSAGQDQKKQENVRHYKKRVIEKCKYWGTGHPPQDSTLHMVRHEVLVAGETCST